MYTDHRPHAPDPTRAKIGARRKRKRVRVPCAVRRWRTLGGEIRYAVTCVLGGVRRCAMRQRRHPIHDPILRGSTALSRMGMPASARAGHLPGLAPSTDDTRHGMFNTRHHPTEATMCAPTTGRCTWHESQQSRPQSRRQSKRRSKRLTSTTCRSTQGQPRSSTTCKRCVGRIFGSRRPPEAHGRRLHSSAFAFAEPSCSTSIAVLRPGLVSAGHSR